VSPWELAAVAVSGVAAGFINSVAGSGTLVTFPTLLALGVPPVTANVSNNIGLVPGSVSGAIGWRHELVGQRARLVRVGSAALAGGVIGAVLLLVLPEDAFGAVVPVLVGLGIVLVAVQPWINRRLAAANPSGDRRLQDSRWLWPGVAATGVYGGYFGAAQGILLMAVLGAATDDSVHRNNAMKNVLAGIVNGTAAVIFILVAHVDWVIAGVIAVGSIVGAQLGAGVGTRLPPAALRTMVVVVGVVALAVFLLR